MRQSIAVISMSDFNLPPETARMIVNYLNHAKLIIFPNPPVYITIKKLDTGISDGQGGTTAEEIVVSQVRYLKREINTSSDQERLLNNTVVKSEVYEFVLDIGVTVDFSCWLVESNGTIFDIIDISSPTTFNAYTRVGAKKR